MKERKEGRKERMKNKKERYKEGRETKGTNLALQWRRDSKAVDFNQGFVLFAKGIHSPLMYLFQVKWNPSHRGMLTSSLGFKVGLRPTNAHQSSNPIPNMFRK